MEPGPFLFQVWTSPQKQLMSSCTTTIIELSMLFQLRITIVTVPTLHGDAICHMNTLEKSDVLLLRTDGNHYSSAGSLFPKGVVACCMFLMFVLFLYFKQTMGKVAAGVAIHVSSLLPVKPLKVPDIWSLFQISNGEEWQRGLWSRFFITSQVARCTSAIQTQRGRGDQVSGGNSPGPRFPCFIIGNP